jgi:uncharacterized protein YndB with AHSA1/START domain
LDLSTTQSQLNKEAVLHKNILRSIAGVFAALLTMVAFSLAANSQTEVKMSVTQDHQKSKTRDLVLTRTFDAPVSEVWKYWEDPEYVKKWWGPDGFTAPLARMDFREGGTSLVCMSSPEFGDLYSIWAYRKIVAMKSIEYIHNLADKEGNKVDPVKMGMPPDFPKDQRHVVTFKALSDTKTEMTVTEYGYTSEHMFDLSKTGLGQCLDKMAKALAKQ